MRLLLLAVLAALPAAAQTPTVRIMNTTRPGASDFTIGDRFEVVVTGPANQPVSVRTTRVGQTDWSPVIGQTDSSGRWSTAGQFDKAAFGDWSEVWTVGGKSAAPIVHFSVRAPCLKGGYVTMFQSGLASLLTCDTAEGRQSFPEPGGGSFLTPDGREIPSRFGSSQTADQYQMEVMQSLISAPADNLRFPQVGDEAAALIVKLLGPNALSGNEIANVLAIVRVAFENPARIPAAAKSPAVTTLLLERLTGSTDQPAVKQQIAETLAYVQSR